MQQQKKRHPNTDSKFSIANRCRDAVDKKERRLVQTQVMMAVLKLY
jgi:hypothetical protein